MFNKFFNTIKDFFSVPALKTQFEEMVLQEEVKKKEPVVADYTPTHGTHAEPVSKQDADGTVTILAEPVHGKHSKPVNDQITDAVTTKPKRARNAKGKLKADDKSTTDVNEAWEGGVAPVKKPRKKKSTSE